MALFTDGTVSEMDDLLAQDSQLADVAASENIDLTKKMELAREEIAVELDAMLGQLSGPWEYWRAQPRTANVAVTPGLKLWHTYRSLEMAYVDAFNSQLNDRYAGRRDQFREKARWARAKLIQTGVGVLFDPLPRASEPTVAATPGAPSPLPDGAYYVSVAWTNRLGEEGASSIATTGTTTSSTLLARPGASPANATGWNVYVGLGPDGMYRQNETPLGIGQTWVQPGTLNTGGKQAGPGQEPNYYQPIPRLIQRG